MSCINRSGKNSWNGRSSGNGRGSGNAACRLHAGFWDRKPEVLCVVRTYAVLFGWAGAALRKDADVVLAALHAHPQGSECWLRCFHEKYASLRELVAVESRRERVAEIAQGPHAMEIHR